MNKLTSHTSCLVASLAATVALTIFAPAALALPASPGASLYVANGGANTIEAITPSGAESLVASNGLNDPFGLAFDSSGNLYISSFEGTTIEKITPSGASSIFATGLSNPAGLAFDNAGNLYVANYGNSTIDVFTPAGVGSVFASTGLNGPTGIAFDGAGNLYVANWNIGTIEKFDSSGNTSLFASGLSNPSGLAVDVAGNLYAANFGGTTVDKFSPSGVGSIFASGLDNPSGLAFDSGGNLYVANYNNNTIDEFTPAGVGSVFVSNGLSIPLMLAFAPAPGVLPQLQQVQASLSGLKVTSLGDKILLAQAGQLLGAATQPVNWVNNSQVTLKGGVIVYAGIFYAAVDLELLQYNNRNNATFLAQVTPLLNQLVAAARGLAATAIANNPASKYAAVANQALQQGDQAKLADVAILDYSIAWALAAGQ